MVELLTHTPNPEEVLKTAYSQCYQKEAKIETIIKHIKHESVLEHTSFTFKAEMSRACMAQLTRHRLASYTIESQRYVDYQKGFETYVPKEISKNPEAYSKYFATIKMIHNGYSQLREMGIKKEDARMLLPQATMCKVVFTMNLRALINFWKLRTKSNAQEEIRNLALTTLELVTNTMPNLKVAITNLVKEVD